MAVLALGISHRRADVALLERLAFADDDLVKATGGRATDPAIDGGRARIDLQTGRDLRERALVPRGFQA